MVEIMDSLKSFRLTYRVVPKDKDILLGKASVEDISDIPFLNIEYSLYHRINFFSKRIFDIFFSGILIIMFSPILFLIGAVTVQFFIMPLALNFFSDMQIKHSDMRCESISESGWR